MKYIFSVLVFMAMAAVGYGQTTAAYIPKSVCGIGAQKCYNDQKDLMNDRLDALDFASGCQVFKTIILCMKNIGSCDNDVDYKVVRQGFIADQDGICGVDGSLQSCGYDLQVCFNEMHNAFADAMNRNFTQACPLIINYANCAVNVIDEKECLPSITVKLNQIGQLLNTEGEVIGCNGVCAQAISLCTANLTTLPTDDSILTADLSKYCKSANSIGVCLKNSKTTAACVNDPGAHLAEVAENQLAKVSDVCKPDGSPSECVTSMIQCAADITGLAQIADVTTQCTVLSEFLECISRLPCMTTLKPLVDTLKEQMETAEIELRCPFDGTCNERFAKCGIQEQGLENVTTANKGSVCQKSKSGISCFDFVKNDPYCINEHNSFVTEEMNMKRLIQLQCGNGASHFAQLSLLVMTLLVGLNQYF